MTDEDIDSLTQAVRDNIAEYVMDLVESPKRICEVISRAQVDDTEANYRLTIRIFNNAVAVLDNEASL